MPEKQDYKGQHYFLSSETKDRFSALLQIRYTCEDCYKKYFKQLSIFEKTKISAEMYFLLKTRIKDLPYKVELFGQNLLDQLNAKGEVITANISLYLKIIKTFQGYEKNRGLVIMMKKILEQHPNLRESFQIVAERLTGEINFKAINNIIFLAGDIRNALNEKNIKSLEAVSVLDLSDAAIKILPSEIGNLSNLKGLWLYNNQLTAIPREIGNLSKLEGLNLYNNQLAALPSEIGNLSKLERLLLHGNQLTAIPS